ncbi:MAG TPA: tetratricopeptide repeat protein [Fimbriimonadaceae bacterium]|nr:tetratricopeptide repeat protein [Fimbriimonadaceae bacterium]HRJ95127.1 tetratricopeptide repeat protein [Fimbriimonadaceae bacterium]
MAPTSLDRRVLARGWEPAIFYDVPNQPDLHRGEIVDLLGSLVEKSLVLYENGRYGLLESVRNYGRDRLASASELEAVSRRHALHIATLLAEAEEGLSGPHQAEWMDLIERERDNVRGAVDYLLARKADPECCRTARAICVSVWKYWSRKGLSLEGLTFLEKASGDDSGDPRQLAAVRSAAGVLATFRGDTDRARSHLVRALELRRTIGDEDAVGRTLNNLGMLLNNVGEFDAARKCYAEALDLFRPGGPSYAYGTMLLNLGNLERYTGRDEEARLVYEESRAVFRRVSDPEGEALSLYNLGLMLADHGEHTDAIELYRLALELFDSIGNERMQAWTLASLGEATLKLGERDTGEAIFRQSSELRRRASEPLANAFALESWAEFLAYDERWGELATLLGCFDSQRESLALQMTPAQIAAQDRLTGAARSHLGESTFADLFARGVAYSPIDLLPA